MQFPKNRANLYVVVRADQSRVVCGAFADNDEATDYAGACEQEWKDRFPDWNHPPLFTVELTTFYG
jgi:hypothetical protein